MTVSDMQRLRELEQENARLKRMYANQGPELELMWAPRPARGTARALRWAYQPPSTAFNSQ